MSRVAPARWANDLTRILNAVFGPDHFPIDVRAVATDFSKQRYPEDPITAVIGENLPGIDGALLRSRHNKGWGIFFNSAVASHGRINFTLAHELGHYLVHRQAYPDGIKCSEQDMLRWESEYRQIEHEANVFAATLLMPLDDYRKNIEPRVAPDFDMIRACAERYDVSTTAATLRWLSYTEKRAVLVVSRDNFILWSRSSDRALKTGAFFRTKGTPIAVPSQSIVARGASGRDTGGQLHAPGVWFGEETREQTVFADMYDFALSLLLLPDERDWNVVRRDESG
jgi:hypothetical protein